MLGTLSCNSTLFIGNYSLVFPGFSFIICDLRNWRIDNCDSSSLSAWTYYGPSFYMMVVLSLVISACRSTSVNVWFCAVWSYSMSLFHHSVARRDWCTENSTNSLKQPRKCCGSWNATHLLSSERSYLHLLFFVEIEKNGSVILCSVLIFRWINGTKQT